MPARLGKVIYWALSGLAALCILLLILAMIGVGLAILAGMAIVVAIAVVFWAVGRATLYVLAGK